jgi:D-alanyl-D-alanine carboxypeptidase (penicillin-binding protein 5/6)
VGSGFDTKKERSTESAKLLRWGLSKFDLIEIAKANSVVETLDVWLGKKNLVGVYTKEDIYKTIPKARKKHLKVSINYNGPVQAPITKDDVLGKLIVSYKGEMIEEYDLLAFENIKRLNLFSRLIRSVNFLIWGDV